MKKKEFESEEFKLGEEKTAHLLQLISIYLSEWDHRATALWNQVFKYFYATLIVLFLPNLAGYLKINPPNNFPNALYPFAALILSIVFLYISIGCAKRAKDAGDKYKNLLKLLPKELRHFPASEPTPKWKKYFYERMSFVICWLMFIVLAGLSVAMLIFYRGL